MIPPELISSNIKQDIPLSCSQRKEALMIHDSDVGTLPADLLSNQIKVWIQHDSEYHKLKKGYHKYVISIGSLKLVVWQK